MKGVYVEGVLEEFVCEGGACVGICVYERVCVGEMCVCGGSVYGRSLCVNLTGGSLHEQLRISVDYFHIRELNAQYAARQVNKNNKY